MSGSILWSPYVGKLPSVKISALQGSELTWAGSSKVFPSLRRSQYWEPFS